MSERRTLLQESLLAIERLQARLEAKERQQRSRSQLSVPDAAIPETSRRPTSCGSCCMTEWMR